MGRIKTIDSQLELLINSIEQTDERLYTLTLLNAASKECVNKNRHLLPGAVATTDMIENCSSSANLKLESLISPSRSTRNSLNTYYTSTLESKINACAKSVNTTSLEYTTCVIDVVS